ncbi:MAG: DciA family protein [Actinomycetaceae bacterium]|nr:DciA family protein [Actinomycetaceae bacterium]
MTSEGARIAKEALARAQQDAWDRGDARVSAATLKKLREKRAHPTDRRGGSSPYPSSRDPQKIGGITRILAQAWSANLQSAMVEAKWPQIAGPHICAHAHVETVDPPRLILRATSTAWATALRMEIPLLLNKIDDHVGAGIITEVTVLAPAAPSWKKGPRSVPGRGPRDTYG